REDEREAEGEDRVHAADGEAVEELLDQQRPGDRTREDATTGGPFGGSSVPVVTGVSTRPAPRCPALLLEEDEGALRAVRLHLDLRDVKVLLDDLAAGRRLEGDLAERSVVRAGDDLLVQLGAELGELH